MSERHYDWQGNWYETQFRTFPEPDTLVLGVYVDNDHRYYGLVTYAPDDLDGRWTEVESSSYVNVTHWMTLPEKPKEHE